MRFTSTPVLAATGQRISRPVDVLLVGHRIGLQCLTVVVTAPKHLRPPESRAQQDAEPLVPQFLPYALVGWIATLVHKAPVNNLDFQLEFSALSHRGLPHLV